MMIKMFQILLSLLFILILALVLPSFYDLAFEKVSSKAFIYYSSVENKMIIRKHDFEKGETHYKDKKGKIYEQDQVDQMLPLTFYLVLSGRDEMPDSIQGQEVSISDIRKNSFFLRIRAKEIELPHVDLYPLFESKPERFKLELPPQYFRINQRMEIIDVKTNKIDEELTDSFTRALKSENFQFPARIIAGNPTTRKSFDEGYFIVDSENELFHVKMVEGEPFCKNTGVSKYTGIKKILVKEMNLREFYALIIAQNNDLYLVTYDDYKLQPLPSEGYIAENHDLRIQGNLFYRLISFYAEDYTRAYVTDREYQLIDSHEETRHTYKDSFWGKAKKYIFPFTGNTTIRKRSFVNLYFSGYNWESICSHLILLVIAVIIIRFIRHSKPSRHITDYFYILIFGIYGFIVILIFNDLGRKL